MNNAVPQGMDAEALCKVLRSELSWVKSTGQALVVRVWCVYHKHTDCSIMTRYVIFGVICDMWYDVIRCHMM